MIITRIPDNYRALGIGLDDPAQVIGRVFPDFLIIGPWRTGTTWLAEMVKRHPELFMTELKETHYFFNLLSAKKTYASKSFTWYLDLFDRPAASGKLVGEASATYACELSPEIIRFIYAINPEIKVIFGIRHPVERAWSHAKMNLMLEAADFAHLKPKEQVEKVLKRKYILNAGHYSRHIRKWLSIIPKEHMYLFEYHRLHHDPVQLFADVCRFLGVNRDLGMISEMLHDVGVVAETQPQSIPVNLERKLETLYRSEIRELGTRYNIHFASTQRQHHTVSPVILLNNQTPRYSETFIVNHIRHLQASTINIRDYLPLSMPEAQAESRSLLDGLRLWLNARRLRRHILRMRSPILIEYGTTAAKALPALRNLNRKIIIHFHGYDAHRKRTVQENQSAYKELFAIAHALVVVSKAMRDTIIAMGAPAEKVYHIVCGVDPRGFPLAQVRNSAPVFFACGRFVEKKAPHLTIMAFHQAWRAYPNIKLRMAGDGPLLKPCQDLVRSLHLEESVEFLGVIDPSGVSHELLASRAFIQHSVTAADGDSEGTPVGILEAGCSGVPVIATRHAGIQDVVIENITGLLCNEGDVDIMAQAIVYLARNPDQAAEMGANAHTHIIKNYAMADMIQKLRNLL